MNPNIRAALDKALAPSLWDLGNQVLYNLCRRHPLHNDRATVVAKIWLIGRAYSAAIERRPVSQGSNDNFYVRTVARAMANSKVDSWIAEVSDLKPSEPTSLEAMLETHARLTRLFESISGVAKRSLASKYLHFHVPRLFYLYDSRAVKALRRFSPSLDRVGDLGEGLADAAYRAFCMKCRQLQKDILNRFHVSLSPRRLDNLLLNVHAKGL